MRELGFFTGKFHFENGAFDGIYQCVVELVVFVVKDIYSIHDFLYNIQALSHILMLSANSAEG